MKNLILAAFAMLLTSSAFAGNQAVNNNSVASISEETEWRLVVDDQGGWSLEPDGNCCITLVDCETGAESATICP